MIGSVNLTGMPTNSWNWTYLDFNLSDTKYIINFPTKKHWREKSKIEYIYQGLDDLIKVIKELNIKSIAIPPLGCGNGKLDWKEVKKIIEEKLQILDDIKIILYEPSESPDPDKIKISTSKPDMTKGRAALIGILEHDLSGGNHVFSASIRDRSGNVTRQAVYFKIQ